MDIQDILYFRMAERLALTVVIVLVSLTVMVSFWRTVQKIDLTDGGKLGLAGSFAFSTPVFVLLTIIGYAWVSLSNEIMIGENNAAMMGAGQRVETDPELQALLREMRTEEQKTTPPTDRANDLSRLEEKLWAINCAAREQDLPQPVQRGLVTAKLALIEPLWDPVLWGPFAQFETWARSGAGPAPAEVPKALYEGVDPRC